MGRGELFPVFSWAFLFHFEGGRKNLDLTDMRALVLGVWEKKGFYCLIFFYPSNVFPAFIIERNLACLTLPTGFVAQYF